MDGGNHATDRLTTTARELAADFAGRAAAHDRDRSFPFENFDALHRAGLLNLIVPVERGGLGGGLREIVTVIGAIAGGDASTALVLLMHYLQLAGVLRSERIPAHLREQVLTDSLAGVSLINALRVEPELGTPARGGLPATTAARTADGWRLSGRKIYSTGSPILRYGLVWARTEGENPRVGLFLVPMQLPGIRMEETWDHMGMRASGSNDVVFEDVLLPADHAVDLRAPKEWATRDLIVTVWNNVAVGALYDGVARAARDWLLGYLHARKPSNLGASLATLPRFQEAVGGIDTMLGVSRVVIDALAERADHDLGSIASTEANLVKYTATNNAIDAVAKALELVGNPGLSRTHPLERHYRDVLCSRVHTPQNDMILQAAGRAALGL
ncbi:MAG TPA: acyl-CoA dehydrogenase family protein [Acetobacteraceae bacterium]|nr:acyl-CoA dehydrogenase family protein [Acetobacteraceae bacterium]